MKIKKQIKSYQKGIGFNYSATTEVSERDRKISNAIIVVAFVVVFTAFLFSVVFGMNSTTLLIIVGAFVGLALMLVILCIKYLVLKKGDKPIYYAKTKSIHNGSQVEAQVETGIIDPKTGQKTIVDDASKQLE